MVAGVNEQEIRAGLYYARGIYEAEVGLFAAALVSGALPQGEEPMPAWDELSERQQYRLAALVTGPAGNALTVGIRAVLDGGA